MGGNLLTGVWGRIRKDPLELLTWAAQQHGDIVQFPLGRLRLYFLAHPLHVQHVLATKREHYSHDTPGNAALRSFLGNGLVTADGTLWQRQRRMMRPAYSKQRLSRLVEPITSSTMALVERWAIDSARGRTIDAAADISVLTRRIIAKSLFSTELGDTGIGEAIGHMSGMARRAATHPLHLPRWVPTPSNRRLRRLGMHVDRTIDDAIRQRRSQGHKDDLSSALMNMEDEHGQRMTDAQLRDEIVTMFVAGHETTSSAVCWTLLLLSRHPSIRRRMQAETDRVLGGRTARYEDLRELSLCRSIVQEAMRLYPPVWAFTRRCETDDTIGGYRIRRGGLMILAPWVTHRDARFWNNPEGFDPDRFRPDAPSLPSHAYFPFGGGPRACIGSNFAMAEAQLILVTLLSRFDADLHPGANVEPDTRITLQPKHGLPMQIRARAPRSTTDPRPEPAARAPSRESCPHEKSAPTRLATS